MEMKPVKPMMFMGLAFIVLGATQRQEPGMKVKTGRVRSSPVPPDRIGFVSPGPEIRG
jgi:hypothetical protein